MYMRLPACKQPLTLSILHFARQYGALLALSLVCVLQISSAFSQLLNLHNLSEEISQAQHERAVRMGEVRQLCPATFQAVSA